MRRGAGRSLSFPELQPHAGWQPSQACCFINEIIQQCLLGPAAETRRAASRQGEEIELEGLLQKHFKLQLGWTEGGSAIFTVSFRQAGSRPEASLVPRQFMRSEAAMNFMTEELQSWASKPQDPLDLGLYVKDPLPYCPHACVNASRLR